MNIFLILLFYSLITVTSTETSPLTIDFSCCEPFEIDNGIFFNEFEYVPSIFSNDYYIHQFMGAIKIPPISTEPPFLLESFSKDSLDWTDDETFLLLFNMYKLRECSNYIAEYYVSVLELESTVLFGGVRVEFDKSRTAVDLYLRHAELFTLRDNEFFTGITWTWKMDCLFVKKTNETMLNLVHKDFNDFLVSFVIETMLEDCGNCIIFNRMPKNLLCSRLQDNLNNGVNDMIINHLKQRYDCHYLKKETILSLLPL